MGSWEGLGTSRKPPGATLVLGRSQTSFFHPFWVWNERTMALRYATLVGLVLPKGFGANGIFPWKFLFTTDGKHGALKAKRAKTFKAGLGPKRRNTHTSWCVTWRRPHDFSIPKSHKGSRQLGQLKNTAHQEPNNHSNSQTTQGRRRCLAARRLG